MTGSSNGPGLCCQVLLAISVVAFGCANNITKQIAAVPLERFTYMMGLVSAVTYVVVYWIIYLVLILVGSVSQPEIQLGWMFLGGGPCFLLSLAVVAAAFIIYCILLFVSTSPLAGWIAVCLYGFMILWLCFCGCTGHWSDHPGMKLLAVAAMGDSLGNVFGYICTPYVSGPVHSLLSQSTTVFVALLSLVLLQKRYSFLQSISLVAVISVAIAGVLPNLASQKSSEGKSTNPFFALLLGLSCVGNALAYISKEYAFSSYAAWVKSGARLIYCIEEDDLSEDEPVSLLYGKDTRSVSEGSDAEDTKLTLHVFTVNTTESTLQLPLTLLLMPLARATGQTHGDDLHTYLIDGLKCMGGVSTDPAHSCEGACEYMLLYVGLNLCFNILVLLSVKLNSALATFVAIKAITPTSAVLFALIDWPLLGRTPVNGITWVVFTLLIPVIALFYWSSRQQAARYTEDPALATCCWPLYRADNDNTVSTCSTVRTLATSVSTEESYDDCTESEAE